VSSAFDHVVRSQHSDNVKSICGLFEASDPGKLLIAVGSLLEDIFADTSSKMYRHVSALDTSVKHSSDMLVSLRASDEPSGGSKESQDSAGLFVAVVPDS